MVKRIVCSAAGFLIILVSVMLLGTTAFAENNTINTITDVSGYTATLYFSDWVDGGVVLKNVKPVIESADTLVAASKLEYIRVPVFKGNIYSKNGDELDLDSLAWYVDADIKFVAAHLADGSYRIIYIVTQ